MIPVEGSPQVLVLRNLDAVRARLTRGRVSRGGIDRTSNKALFRVVRVTGLDVRAANIPQAGDALAGGRGGHLEGGLRAGG